MSLRKVAGVWQPSWQVTETGAGFADVNLSPDEMARLNTFLLRYEESGTERQAAWNERGKRYRRKSVQVDIYSGNLSEADEERLADSINDAYNE